MPESLLSEATVHLFGREMSDLKLDTGKYGDGTVAAAVKGAKRVVARIHAFAFQGEFVQLVSPALFVLPATGAQVKANLDLTGLARIPDTLNQDLTVWTVERDDLTVRLDVMTGSYGRVLLDYELAEDGLQGFVRGGEQLGRPAPLGVGGRRRRRWRSDEE